MKRSNCLAAAVAAIAVLCLPACCVPALADTLNGSPNLVPYSESADVVLDWAAESFTVGTQFDLTGIEFFTDEYTPLWDGTLQVDLFASNGSKPGTTPIATFSNGAIKIERTVLVDGSPTDDNSIVQYDVPLSAVLDPGTYWVAIHMKSDYNYPDVMGWDDTTTPHAQIAYSASGGDFNNWQAQGLQLALGYTGQNASVSTPEPASFAFAGLGLAGLALLRQRRSNRPTRISGRAC
jgi:MYXO-CTERM domain-containing protein